MAPKAATGVEKDRISYRAQGLEEYDQASDGDPEKELCRLFTKVVGTISV